MEPKEIYKLQYVHDAYGKHLVKDGYCHACLCNVKNGKSINMMTSPVVMYNVYWGTYTNNSPEFLAGYMGVMLAHYCKSTYQKPGEAMEKLNAPNNPALEYFGQKPIAQALAGEAVKIASDILSEDK